MKLVTIKLSGFKSFAEPTHFDLPGQMVGVVGPNGCGKSNIMDAVRWVLGESKASELRGESMQDVIFNGTTTRKPANRASVELVFDNADHRVSGPWGQFTEISVKRILTRDGGSTYLINNQVVRRRDVQDVFLGTGLGPRAYAIIGQGTISRILESKPEDLRLFLEEASGVSKYKERRRETENRLHDTKKNLLRVEDILQELSQNLTKLEEQAKVAKSYNELQNTWTRRQHQQWFLKRTEAQINHKKIQQEGLAAFNTLEGKIADLRHVDAQLEETRQAHYSASDHVNQAQGKLYEASTTLGKLEAQSKFSIESKARAEQNLLSLQTQKSQWQQKKEEVGIEIEVAQAACIEAEILLETLSAQKVDQQEQMPAYQEKVDQSQSKVTEQQKIVIDIEQQLRILSTEDRGNEEHIKEAETRLEKLQQQFSSIELPSISRYTDLDEKIATLQGQIEEIQARSLGLEMVTEQAEFAQMIASQVVTEKSKNVNDISAKLDALVALQEQLKQDEKLQPWLVKHGLDNLPSLWNTLHIDTGWETAVESMLRELLHAKKTSRLEIVQTFDQDQPPTRMVFFTDMTNTPSCVSSAKPLGLRRLVDLVKSTSESVRHVLSIWLQNYFVASNLHEAMSHRYSLVDKQCIVTQAGHRVDACSVTFYAPDSEQSGLLARATEIHHLEKALRAESLILNEEKNTFSRAQYALEQAKRDQAESQRNITTQKNILHQLELEHLRLSQQIEQCSHRKQQIDQEIQEATEKKKQYTDRLTQSQARFEHLDIELGNAQDQQIALQNQLQTAQSQFTQFQEQCRSLDRHEQETQFEMRNAQSKVIDLQKTIRMTKEQIVNIVKHEEDIVRELEQLATQTVQMDLHDALESKLLCEQELGEKRLIYDQLTAQLRSQDELRMKLENSLEPLRKRITDFQLNEQAAKIGYEQFDLFLQEANANVDALQASINEEKVSLSGLQNEIDRLHQSIQALGAVNLAAIDELQNAVERKQYLDAQHADLTKAIDTLIDAIKKIDEETRELLANTFNQVNEHFGRMFPELFGGGSAKLIMTGHEILDAGVQVMAQPPGKKNQTIYLLSGGEKALTAIALVFAIFQLNPAPFCLLDEVDAPLDDANTERYAKLVSSMSRETQFLFISHNKIAMEMAQQLIGVTMQEQGVSRIVAVNMDTAPSIIA